MIQHCQSIHFPAELHASQTLKVLILFYGAHLRHGPVLAFRFRLTAWKKNLHFTSVVCTTRD